MKGSVNINDSPYQCCHQHAFVNVLVFIDDNAGRHFVGIILGFGILLRVLYQGY
jgi:hypothetical protein